jgi:putative DNA primase/helicase
MDAKIKGRVVRMPKRTKDSSALYVKDPRKFKDNLRLLVVKGKPIKPEDQSSGEGEGATDGLSDSLRELDERGLHDVGLARRFAAQHRDHVRFCASLGWLLWDGRRWELLGNKGVPAEVIGLAKQTVKSILGEAQAQADDPDKYEPLVKFNLASNKRPRIEAMVALAKPDLLIKAKLLDADPFALNCLNGTIDLRTGKLRPHDPDALITKLTPVAYDPRAKAPRWMKFLDELFNTDRDLISYTQRSVGYSITGDQREQGLWIAYGGGSNGKGTFMRAIQAVAGEYATVARRELLVELRHGGSQREDTVALRGARFVVASETGDRQRLDEAQVKNLTGNDAITTRYLFREQFTFWPTHHIWLQTNKKPIIVNQDHAIWRRINLLPFLNVFKKPYEKVIAVTDGGKVLPADTGLDAKLAEELPGILAWAVRGATAWWNRGKPILSQAKAVKEAVAEYRAEENVVGIFVAECCEVDKKSSVVHADLMECLNAWFKARGEHPWGTKTVTQRFGDAGYPAKPVKNVRSILGLRFKPLPTNKSLAADFIRQAAADKRDDSYPMFKRPPDPRKRGRGEDA